MQIHPIKTDKITPKASDDNCDLYDLLDRHLTAFQDGSVLAITSKIVALCQGRVVKIGEREKQALIETEADYFLPPSASNYAVSLTIKGNRLIPSAGIDESNSNGYYVLWPQNTQEIANGVRAYLQRRFACQRVGVIVTDSTTAPLRWGVTGIALAHSGFRALNDYVGTVDLFGRRMQMTQGNVADGLAAAAVLVMGEGDEQTPLAVMNDLPFVAFQDRDPSAEELQRLHIDKADDLYAPLLQAVPWRKGGR